MLTPKSWTKLSVVAITIVLAGCGSSSSSGVSAGSYVKAICSSIGPFEKDVQARAGALNLSAITNVSQGKTALVGFLDAMVTDTDKAVTQLKAAGNPDVKNGKAIAAGVVSAFTKLKQALQTAANQAKSLPTSSPDAFKTAATTLGTTVRTTISTIGGSLNGLKSSQLESAAAKDPTCKSLSSG
jgi:hypothetical protein